MVLALLGFVEEDVGLVLDLEAFTGLLEVVLLLVVLDRHLGFYEVVASLC